MTKTSLFTLALSALSAVSVAEAPRPDKMWTYKKIDGKQLAERVSGIATNQNQSEALKSRASDIDFPTTD